MTAEEICEKLGLEPPDEFKLEAHWRNCDLHFAGAMRFEDVFTRRYGKTTRTIVFALEELSENPETTIMLVANNPYQAKHMLAQAQEWAHELGLPSHRIKSHVAQQQDTNGLRGFNPCQVFLDLDGSTLLR